MKPLQQMYGIAQIKAQNAQLRETLQAVRGALQGALGENEMLHRRLSTAADKQILLLNKLIEAKILGDDARGKRCPHCDGPLVSFSSMNLRICADCDSEFDWHLAPGQKPLLANSRLGA